MIGGTHLCEHGQMAIGCPRCGGIAQEIAELVLEAYDETNGDPYVGFWERGDWRWYRVVEPEVEQMVLFHVEPVAPVRFIC